MIEEIEDYLESQFRKSMNGFENLPIKQLHNFNELLKSYKKLLIENEGLKNQCENYEYAEAKIKNDEWGIKYHDRKRMESAANWHSLRAKYGCIE